MSEKVNLNEIGDQAQSNYQEFNKADEAVYGSPDAKDDDGKRVNTGLNGYVDILAKVAKHRREDAGPKTRVQEWTVEKEKKERHAAAGVDELAVHATNLEHAKLTRTEALSTATNHYHENEAAYHDRAVIEAHLGGVAINVEQPLEIGQQVPVRVAEHVG